MVGMVRIGKNLLYPVTYQIFLRIPVWSEYIRRIG